MVLKKLIDTRLMESFNSKVLLFGEYSVLNHGKALVMPCDLFSGQLNFFAKANDAKYAYRSNEYLKKFSAFIASQVDENFVLEVKRFEWEINNGLFFESSIPQGYGLGSSGALVVAIFLRYLKKAKEIKDELKGLTIEKAYQLKTTLGKMESYFHGTSSGLDPLSIILNEPILYKGMDQVETAVLPAKNEDGENHIFLLNTQMPRNTSSLVTRYNELYKEEGFRKKINDQLLSYTNESIDNFLGNHPSEFYKSLDRLVQFQLEEMNAFIPAEFQETIKKGIDNGDYFLKLCGAGGGGYMLGFTNNWSKTKADLKDSVDSIYQY